MALVVGDINWQGYGKVTDADSTTGWAVIKTTSGGGTPSVALADGGLQGATTAQAITTTSNAKRILLYYDIGSGNELDFSVSGTEENEFVWVWGNFLASSLLEASSANGFGIMLGTDNAGTVEWSCWTFYGNDNYAGGWKRMVIDPTKTASLTGSGSTEGGGGVTLSSVRYFGIMAKTSGTARFDNMLVDRIDVGTGYAIDGTTGTADAFMSDLLALEESVANWWGVIQRLNDAGTAYELVGKLTLGDSAGTTATTLSDINSKIFAAEPLYYNSGLVAALPLTATGVEFVGNGTGATSVTLGKIVGTDGGRNGWTLVGNDTYDVSLDIDVGGNVNTANLYGCAFEALTGTISLSNNTGHDCFATSWTNCAQVDAEGAIPIRNNTFVGTTSTTGALLWNANIDIEDCAFIANTTGEGTEHDTIESVATGTCTSTGSSTQLLDTGATFTSTVAVNDYAYNETDGSYAKVTSVVSNTELTTEALTGGSDNTWQSSDAYSISPAVTYQNLTFSGNTTDVTNSATGSDALFVSKSGTSDPSTSTGTVVFLGSVPITITVRDQANAAVENAQTSVKLSDGTVILNADTNASGVASTSFTGATPSSVVLSVRKASGGINYVNYSTTATIQSGTGLVTTVVLQEDTVNST